MGYLLAVVMVLGVGMLLLLSLAAARPCRGWSISWATIFPWERDSGTGSTPGSRLHCSPCSSRSFFA